MKSIVCRDLHFSYESHRVLMGCSFTMEPGCIYALVGRNGSGKTTLLRILNGYLKPSQGNVYIDNKEASSLSRKDFSRKIAFVPQEHAGIFSYTVREMVVMGRNPYLNFFERPSSRDFEKAEAALESIGLFDLASKNYMEISGGERQLVLIARAIAQDAPFFLFDEPTSHLDFNNQYRVLNVIRDICRKSGCGVLASMHDPNLVAAFADRVVFLKAGRIAAAGESSSIMTDERLQNLYEMDLRVLSLGDRHVIIPN